MRKTLDAAIECGFDSVVVMGYKKGSYQILHSSGVSTEEEIGALVMAQHCIIESSKP